MTVMPILSDPAREVLAVSFPLPGWLMKKVEQHRKGCFDKDPKGIPTIRAVLDLLTYGMGRKRRISAPVLHGAPY